MKAVEEAGFAPKMLVTDKLHSSGATEPRTCIKWKRELLRFKAVGSAQCFRANHVAVRDAFNRQRRLTSRRTLCLFRAAAWPGQGDDMALSRVGELPMTMPCSMLRIISPLGRDLIKFPMTFSALRENRAGLQEIFNKAVDTFSAPPYKPAPDGVYGGRNESQAPLLIDIVERREGIRGRRI